MTSGANSSEGFSDKPEFSPPLLVLVLSS
uniref:Protein ZINC INDUCED FACILITATOR 1-like isoform X2 n=1 Tax=Rhizophora mucronata TaxID=61149 RepID=A0A2P2QB39_RHIMU